MQPRPGSREVLGGRHLDMAKVGITPGTAQTMAPEPFTMLHKRMNAAEEQTKSLLKDLAKLGVNTQNFHHFSSSPGAPSESYNAIPAIHSMETFADHSDTGLKNDESLVNRLCHMESIIQTLKLNIFRLHTEKELNPRHSDQLQAQLAAMQEEHTREMKAAQMEVMRLRQKLCEECEEKAMVQDENERLSEALEIASATKLDAAVTAEELRATKSRMGRRIHELQELLSQETSLRKSLEESQAGMLQRVQDLEKAVEAERTEVQVLRQDNRTLRSDAQDLQDKQQQQELRIQQVEQESTHLKSELDARDGIIAQLHAEAKDAESRLKTELSEKMQITRDLMTMKEKFEHVQAQNDQLEQQCSEMSACLRTLTMENAKLVSEHQATLKAEQEKMAKKLHEQDLLLDAARLNITAELKSAQSERNKLERELSSLQAEHSQCVEKQTLADEKMAMRKTLMESTIGHLREDLEATMKERDALLKEKDSILQENTKTLNEIAEDRDKLETELIECKIDLKIMQTTLQSQKESNRSLMEELASLELQQYAQQHVEQALLELTDSRNKLAYEKGRLQARVHQLEDELESLGDAWSENTQLRKINTALEAKYSQVSAECNSGKICTQRLDAQLKQAQSVLERQEQDFELAIKSRDEAMRECQKLKSQMEATEDRERQKISSLQRQLSDVKEDKLKISSTLENVLTSHNLLQQTVEKVQIELGSKDSDIAGLKKERSLNHHRIQLLENELAESLSKLQLMDTQQRTQVEPLRKAYDVSREDNKKLALNLEKSLQTNSDLQSKLNRIQDELDSKDIEFQQLQTCREQEIEEAKVETKLSMERLDALKKQLYKEQESAKKRAQRDNLELKKALEDITSKSADLSSANRLLIQKVTEMEKVLADQRTKLKRQKTQLTRYKDAKTISTEEAERQKQTESELKQMELLNKQYQKENQEQALKIQEFLAEMNALQGQIKELATCHQDEVQLKEYHEGLLQDERKQRHHLERKCQNLEDTVKKLKKFKEAAEKTLKDASVESEQISLNLEEAHRWFTTKFDSLKLEMMQTKHRCTPSCSEETLRETEAAREENKDFLSILCQELKDAVDERPTKLQNYSSPIHSEAEQGHV
ncbi:coiled-coil domain-containing protein 150 [Lissotriton helveticus]